MGVAVIAILLVMATRYYLTTSVASDVNQVVSDIQGLTSCVENWKQGYIPTPNKDLTAFKLGDCVANGWFPPARTNSGDENAASLLTPWGTNATLTPSANELQVLITTNTKEQAKSLTAKLGGDPTKTTSTTVTYKILAQTVVQ